MLRGSPWATSFTTLALIVAVVSCLLSSFPRGANAATIDPNDKGEPLFPDGHPNITYLTDENWDETMAKYNDKPWIVDFYHPFCPHCKHFAPTYFEAAAYYKVEGSIHIGAISCMDHVKCRRVGIKGFPTLIALGFDKSRPGKEVKRVVGTHTLQEVKNYISTIFAEAAFNETGSYPPSTAPPPGAPVVVADVGATGMPLVPATTVTPEAVPGEQVRKELWEESTKPMNQTTRLQDAASAFIFGLKQGVFMGREVLEDVELDALKSWLALVSKTFPGEINRKVISKLNDVIQPLALLDFDTFDQLLTSWQHASVFYFLMEEANFNFDENITGVRVPAWQRLNNLFIGQGVTYRACALYTCGQWNMFHMLTMNPPLPATRDSDLLVSVIATMRRFMKHFFGCVQCRDHFLEYNNLDMVKKIQAAKNKPLALKRWLWTMHNAVNTRIRHPLWPKPEICPTCGTEGNWLDVEVDKWLGNTYAYREVEVPRLATTTTTATMTTAPPLSEQQALLRKEADAALPEAPQAQPVATVATTLPAGLIPEQALATTTTPLTTTTTKTTTTHEEDAPWKPKDADLGIDNPAQKVHHDTAATKQPNGGDGGATELDANAKAAAGGGDTLQGAQAPPVSLFAWYILPIGAVAGYLLFVRSRKRERASFRSHSARE